MFAPSGRAAWRGLCLARQAIRGSAGLSRAFSSAASSERFLASRSRTWVPYDRLSAGRYVFATIVRGFHTSNAALFRKDPYTILGVSRSSSKDEIKQAYYKLAKKYHPDLNKNDKDAAEKFREINAAYEILSDDKKTSSYQRTGYSAPEYESSQAYQDPFSIFNEFMRNFTGQAEGFSEQRAYNMDLTFLEAANGCEKDFTYKSAATCDTCNGTKKGPNSRVIRCTTCGGSGVVQHRISIMAMQMPCPSCRGSGSHISNPCSPCSGTGFVEKMRTVTVNIPAGVNNGDVVHGKAMKDLVLQIRVQPHEYFKREGDDIHLSVKLNLAQALLGGKLTVPTIRSPYEFDIPKGLQPNDKKVVRGLGVKDPRINRFGDMHIHFDIELPKSLTSSQEEMIRKFARESGWDMGEGEDEKSDAKASGAESKQGIVGKLKGFFGGLFKK